MRAKAVSIIAIAALLAIPAAAFADYDTYVTLWQRKMTPSFSGMEYSASAAANIRPAIAAGRPIAVYFATNFQPNFGYGAQALSISVPLRELPAAEFGNCGCFRTRDLDKDFPCDAGCNECGGQYLYEYNNVY